MHSQPSSLPARGGDMLALVSLFMSLIVPLAIVPYLVLPVIVFNMFGGYLEALFIPASFTAIVTGHVALIDAKSVHRALAHRWMAILGLLLGYLGLAIVAWLVVELILTIRPR